MSSPLLAEHGKKQDEGAQDYGRLLVSKGLILEEEVHVLTSKFVTFFLPNVPVLMSIVWMALDEHWTAYMHNDMLARFALVFLAVVFIGKAMSDYATVLLLQGSGFRKVVSTHEAPEELCNQTVNRWFHPSTWIGAFAIVAVFPCWQGMCLAVSLIASQRSLVFKVGSFVDAYAKLLVARVHKHIVDFEPDAKSQLLDGHMQKSWIMLRELQRDLNGLYTDALPFNVSRMFTQGVLSVGCALLSMGCVKLGSPILVFGPSLLSLTFAFLVISKLQTLSKVTDCCLSTKPNGLLGALLDKGEYLPNMCDSDHRFYNAMKDEFKFKKFGAQVGVTIDRTLIATVLASGSAVFISFFISLTRALHIDDAMQSFGNSTR